jgi:hypothetical protein
VKALGTMRAARQASRLPQAELFGEAGSFDAGSFDDRGDAFCLVNDAASRRSEGITLTPRWLVDGMLAAVAGHAFETIVDCGAGTGRFAIAAALRFPKARVVAIEQNATLAALLRQRAEEHGVATRIDIVLGDFREVDVPLIGRALFVGNPPYVRHHDIPAPWKAWYAERMGYRGIVASRLAGLHAHFFLRACELMRPGDELCFVTSAEWLDNDYGRALRALLSGPISACGLWLSDSAEPVFADALVSSVVVKATYSDNDAVEAGALARAGLQTVRSVGAMQLRKSDRWTPWCRPSLPSSVSGTELGELFHIHRGQVTGLNRAWVLGDDGFGLPAEFCVPAVTRAKELIDGCVLSRAGFEGLHRVVDLPPDLDSIALSHRGAVDRFLARARAMGAAAGYIARHRKSWHAVGMRSPPAAFVSYMGRRPPVFRANPFGASFINVAHGLYPRQTMAAVTLANMLDYLNRATDRFAGRTYGGGLAKFEPSDVARLRVPVEAMERAA